MGALLGGQGPTGLTGASSPSEWPGVGAYGRGIKNELLKHQSQTNVLFSIQKEWWADFDDSVKIILGRHRSAIGVSQKWVQVRGRGGGGSTVARLPDCPAFKHFVLGFLRLQARLNPPAVSRSTPPPPAQAPPPLQPRLSDKKKNPLIPHWSKRRPKPRLHLHFFRAIDDWRALWVV